MVVWNRTAASYNARPRGTDVTAVLRHGRRVHVFVEHAIGSLQRPMSDAALAAKFAAQSDPVLGAARTAQLIAACQSLGRLTRVRELTALATPLD